MRVFSGLVESFPLPHPPINLTQSNKYILTPINTNFKPLRVLKHSQVDMSHDLKASKDFMKCLTTKDNFKNVTYEKLPQQINTLLTPYNQIAN